MAARANKKTKKALKPVVITPSQTPLPNVITLTKRSLILLGKNWKVLAGIGVWYVVVGIVFGSIALGGYDVAHAREQLGGKVAGSLGTYITLLSSGGGVSSQASQAYGAILFVVFSLAIIWALRHVYDGSSVRIRDAYYRGMYPLVPFALVMLAALLSLLPLIIGASLYELVVANGIATTSGDYVLWLVVVIAGFLASLYLLAVPILALYVVALPDMTPMTALRAAKRLTLGRRWLFIRKMLFLPVVLLVLLGIIMLPIILLAPVTAQAVLAVCGVAAIVLAHVYLYELYRSSME